MRRVILASIILAVPLPIHDLWIVAVHRTCTCVRFATASTRGELTGLTPLAPSPRTAGPEIALPLFRDTALLAFHFHGSPRLARILWTVPDARNKIALWVNVGNRYPILPLPPPAPPSFPPFCASPSSASSISSVRSSDQMVSSSSLLVRPSVRFVWPYVHDQQLYNFRCKSSSSCAHSNKCSLPYYMAAPLTRINGLMHLYQNLLYNIGTKFIFLD